MDTQTAYTSTYPLRTRPAWLWRLLLLLLTLLLSVATAMLASATYGGYLASIPLALAVALSGYYLIRSGSLRKTLVVHADGTLMLCSPSGKQRIALPAQKLVEVQAPDLNADRIDRVGLMFERKRIRLSTPPLARHSRKKQLHADYQRLLLDLVPQLGLVQKPNRASKRIYCYYNPAYLDSLSK